MNENVFQSVENEIGYLQAENATLREALKGAQIIAEQAKGHIAEITTLRADLKKRYAIENSKQDCINKLTNDLTRYRTAEAEGRIRWLPDTGIGDLSDGYHTFNELYHHRAVLFSAICNLYPSRAWKSKKHHDGTMFDGMFIVGINTPYGQATYHYDIKPYWDYFGCLERDLAPEWDGLTPNEAIERLLKLGSLDSAQTALEAQGSEAKPIYTEHDHEDYFTRKYRCGHCHAVLCQYNYGREWCDDGKNMAKPSTCPNCGRKVDWSEIEEAQGE